MPRASRGEFVYDDPTSESGTMRYLILSDIHANLTALDAVLEAAEGRWVKAVCLGDLVGYGPDPNEVIDRVRSLGAVTIRGNHDKAVSGVEDGEEFNPIARSAVVWTRQQLRPENCKYLEELPQGPLPVDDFSIVHGAVRDEDEYIFVPSQAMEGLLDAPSHVVFFGHTHIQGGFALRDSQVDALHFKPAGGKPFSTLSIEADTTYLLNPGSIGQARDGDTRAAFAIADIENHSVEFWRVPYDIESVQTRMARAGLPEPLILRLSFGR
ncbi:MAG TPA: metallophosphoesterase family protein [Candidatus Polarisedimenticolia bacterium]|nr:metallophosphoesterase family protein [Candidatus Polarisedimenticolia bacterium]